MGVSVPAAAARVHPATAAVAVLPEPWPRWGAGGWTCPAWASSSTSWPAASRGRPPRSRRRCWPAGRAPRSASSAAAPAARCCASTRPARRPARSGPPPPPTCGCARPRSTPPGSKPSCPPRMPPRSAPCWTRRPRRCAATATSAGSTSGAPLAPHARRRASGGRALPLARGPSNGRGPGDPAGHRRGGGAARRSTGSDCWATTSARPSGAACARGRSSRWRAGSGRCSCSRSCSRRRAARPMPPTSMRPGRWPPTSASTKRSYEGSPPAAGPACRAPFAPRCSGPTTGWSATSLSSSA